MGSVAPAMDIRRDTDLATPNGVMDEYPNLYDDEKIMVEKYSLKGPPPGFGGPPPPA